MATVPVMNTPNVTPGALPGAQLQSPASVGAMTDAMTGGIKQDEALGAAGSNLTSVGLDIATKIQNQANAIKVQQATNDARQAALNLQYGQIDPQTGQIVQPGYSQIKGQSALQRDSGVPLTKEYSDQYAQTLGDIYNNLGNDAQKRMFAEQQPSLQTSFTSGVQTHVMQQYQEYSQSVAKGAIDIAQNTAALQWQNPDNIDQAVEQAKTGVKTLLQGVDVNGAGGQGASANAVVNAQNLAESSIRSKVIDTALENNNPTYATAYFNKYKSAMSADDILRVQAKLNTQVDQHVAMDAVNHTTQDNLHLLAPTTADRAFNLAGAFQVAVGTESGGQQFDKNGQPLTSPKGATGIAQVMPTTGPEAAQLAGLPWDENRFKTDAKYNYQLGQAYFNKQVQDFGGIDKGFAAYNAGPQALKDAMAKAQADGKPQQWLSYLPKETQNYVTKNTQSLQMGGGVPAPPTKQEFVAAALDPKVIGTDPRPQVVSLIRDQAEKQYDLIMSSRKEQGENAMQQVQRALDANGGDMTQLSPNLMSAVTQYAPDKIPDVQKYARSIASPEIPLNVQAYSDFYQNPEKYAKMSEGDFATWVKSNIPPGRVQDQVIKARTNEINGTPDDSVQSINVKAFNDTLNSRLKSMGMASSISSKDDDTQKQLNEMRVAMTKDIYDQQTQVGHKFTPQEIATRIDQTIGNYVHDKFWSNNKRFLDTSDIPKTDMDLITASYAKRGITSPTKEQILTAYWKGKSQ